MLIEVPYNRTQVIEYAKKWAFKRNPAYFDFDKLGGDCTNFVSQCVFAGSHVMNYTPVYGWYYNSSRDRSASWSGVQYLFNFLTSNKSAGPYAVQTDGNGLQVGDILQFGDADNHFYHTSVVTQIGEENIFLSAHSFDAYLKPLSGYTYKNIRYLHIQGVRKYEIL